MRLKTKTMKKKTREEGKRLFFPVYQGTDVINTISRLKQTSGHREASVGTRHPLTSTYTRAHNRMYWTLNHSLQSNTSQKGEHKHSPERLQFYTMHSPRQLFIWPSSQHAICMHQEFKVNTEKFSIFLNLITNETNKYIPLIQILQYYLALSKQLVPPKLKHLLCCFRAVQFPLW